MKAIRVAVSAAGIAAMVAVVASGQMALVAADGELKALRSYLRSIPMHKQWNSEFNAFFACLCRNWVLAVL